MSKGSPTLIVHTCSVRLVQETLLKDARLMHTDCIGFCGTHPLIILICPSQTDLNKRLTMWDMSSQKLPPLHQCFECWKCTTQFGSGFTQHTLLSSMWRLV
jgi:hypothetical protein